MKSIRLALRDWAFSTLHWPLTQDCSSTHSSFPASSHGEFCVDAVQEYRNHFELVIKFLLATEALDDVAWRSSRRLLEFHEIRGTCLGYGAASIQGTGFGRDLTACIQKVGKQIVDLGVRDPDLFPAMALFESNIGPDRISDMATNIVRRPLVEFNKRILSELGLVGEKFQILDTDGHFLVNRDQTRRTPLILVPTDVLRPLPIVRDWDGIADAASHNESLRLRVNQHIGHIWARKTKRDKARLREQALASKDAFQALLDAIHAVPRAPYDTIADPDGLVRWARVAREYAARFPLRLAKPRGALNLSSAHRIVKKIVDRSRQLVANNGLSKELYRAPGKPRHESTAQRLFFAVAHCYCEAQNLDVSPEVDSGSGRIDFKFSQGFDCRVLVEVKLSTNSKLVAGYSTQLETYKAAEQTMRAIYLVIDVGKMRRKDKALVERRNDARRKGEPLSDLEFIDGRIRPPASKR
ncbi:MAG: hypothetical protein ABSG86_22210 [Thermoguttaceae bacterium]